MKHTDESSFSSAATDGATSALTVRQRSSHVRKLWPFFFAAAVVLALAAPQSHAAMAVIDIRAIRELGTQIRTLRDQLNTARDHFNQARDEYRSITGARGMEQLLNGTVRNYLPQNWNEIAALLDQASVTYTALSADLQHLVDANAILTDEHIESLSDNERRELDSARRSVAMARSMTREALSTTSQRFTAIQQLIDAIPRATDQKAILDLQARIQAEQGMLANEHSKLQVLFEASAAEEAARRQRLREQAIADIGSLRTLPRMGLSE